MSYGKKKWFLFSGILITGILIWLSWPTGATFQHLPYSTMAVDRNGRLIGARIAGDGQWRFPPPDSVPGKFKAAICTYEDKRFDYHPGVDPLSLARAIRTNIRAGKIVSGASTLTMQVIRLSRPDRPRSYLEKIIEILLALRLDWQYTKSEILNLYASHAPFGGNMVGLETAAWRYYGRKPSALSWGETATLAVLPNSPGMVHPGKNRQQLREKRDLLLDRLQQEGYIDSLTATLAKAESLPREPLPLPDRAPHLLELLRQQEKRSPRYTLSLDMGLQEQVTETVRNYCSLNSKKEIHNMAALVLDIERNEVLAYVGNSPEAGIKYDEHVDIIQAPRSTGSILKPFLFAYMVDEGLLTPDAFVMDVPTQVDNYRPLNFDKRYSGVVSARQALVRSLNVPAVRMLQAYGIEKFHRRLQECGMETLIFDPEHYGLTLILGGAEGTLWDITNMYAGFARTVKQFYARDGLYDRSDFQEASFTSDHSGRENTFLRKKGPISAGAAYLMFETLQEVKRPDVLGAWMHFESAGPIAWKTGTSFGFRDAWAIGTDSEYAVGVWVGNANGEGRPDLTGLQKAAPVMFRIFDHLPRGSWFEPPLDEMKYIPVCEASGWRAGPHCPVDSVLVPSTEWKAAVCTFHFTAWVDEHNSWRYNRNCSPDSISLHRDTFLQLPPSAAFYYRQRTANYRPLPPFHPNCTDLDTGSPMEWIYPVADATLHVPVLLDGSKGAVVLQAAHQRPDAVLYWHMNEKFIGTTNHPHEFSISPMPGMYRIEIRDDRGNKLVREIDIITSSPGQNQLSSG